MSDREQEKWTFEGIDRALDTAQPSSFQTGDIVGRKGDPMAYRIRSIDKNRGIAILEVDANGAGIEAKLTDIYDPYVALDLAFEAKTLDKLAALDPNFLN